MKTQKTYNHCRVMWLEFKPKNGGYRHFSKTEKEAHDCKVVLSPSGKVAEIYDSDGTFLMRKRLSTRSFSFEQTATPFRLAVEKALAKAEAEAVVQADNRELMSATM